MRKTLYIVSSAFMLAVIISATPMYTSTAHANVTQEDIDAQIRVVKMELIDALHAHVRLLRLSLIDKLEYRVAVLQAIADAQNK